MKQLLSLLLLLTALPAPAGPRDWKVDFEVRALDRVLVPRGAAQSRTGWYCVYRLDNRTGSDRDLALRLFVETDVSHGPPDARRAERHCDAVDPSVQRVVEARMGIDPRQPLLDAIQVQGRIRDGEQREAIAVFWEVSSETDVIDLYVIGLTAAADQSEVGKDGRRRGRLGEDFQKMFRAGTKICSVQRSPAGEYAFRPLARRITLPEYKQMDGAGKSLCRSVNEAEGEVLYALDDPILVDTEPKHYLEHSVLRLRYRRFGDERKPQLDTYRLELRESFLGIEPLPANP